MKYFGVMQIYKVKGNRITDEWFIHFIFDSSYDGAEDCSQHDDDYWEGFWKLPGVNYDKIVKQHFASPSAWNYIRPASEVDISDLHLGKWMNHSPFYKHGRWQRVKNGNERY